MAMNLARISGDRLTVEIICEPLKSGDDHELHPDPTSSGSHPDPIRAEDGEPHLPPRACHTLVEIPTVE